MRESTDIYPLHDAAASERYRALWATSPQRSPFSSLGLSEALARAFGLRAEVLLARRGERDTAGLVVCSRRRGPFREVLVPPFCSYSALVLADEPSEANVHQERSPFSSLAEVLARRYDLVRLHLPPSLADVRPFQWQGWQAAPLYTYRLPLAGTDATLAAWSAGTRRTYARAQAEYVVAEEPDAAMFVAETCAESYRRQGTRLSLPPDVLAGVVRDRQAEGEARLFVARRAADGAPEAGLAVLHDERHAAYWVAGSVPGASMTVLLGEVLPRLHADGLETLDFVGANTASIAEFKRRFGASLMPYFRLETVPHPALRFLLALRR